ncbi:SRPBCC domain-containing protein [Paenibacillus sp. Marseille-Q4541]|uniref:SRPBCC family protein n=1 Tax=Paenibacillus sp. Marseille-Q4541 TaxID=2831522 RepID=UPI0032D58B99
MLGVKSVTAEASIQAPLELVWYAWVISERVSEWFAPQAIIEARDGGAYELYFVPGNVTNMNTKGCKVTKFNEKKELHFTWKGPDPFEKIMNHEKELTIVEVTFDSVDDCTTIVNVRHTGFKDEESWDEAVNWHQMAWPEVLGSLKSALEKGEGNLCCQP